MKRRLSEGFSLKADAGGLDDNDDEAEKQQVRAKTTVAENAFAVPKKLPPGASPLGSPLKPMNHDGGKRLPMGMPKEAAAAAKVCLEGISSSRFQSGTKLSNNQLSELYSNCIKLSAENKINQKNSWALNLIDYLPDVLETQYKTEDGIANFQAASVTLDTSVKIYSYRVDSVHTETYKVLGGLSRTDARPEDEDEEAEPAEEVEDGGDAGEEGSAPGAEGAPEAGAVETKGKKERAKRIIVGGVNTLENNLENLNVKKFDMEFSVDPLFRKTSAAFDAGGARGLLLNHLNVYNGCEIIFDSSDTLGDHGGSADYDRIDEVDLTDLKPLIGSNVKNLELCPQLAGFQMTDMLENDGILLDEKQVDEADLFDLGGDDDDADAMERSLIEQIHNDGGDEDGDAIVPLDEAAAAPKPSAAGTAAANPFLAQRNASLGNMLTDQPNEYDYFNPQVVQNWAGPDHWKFRPGPKKPAAGAAGAVATRTDEEKDAELDGEAAGGKKKRSSKKQFFIDFSAPADKAALESAFAPPAKAASTLLSAAVLDRADSHSSTLPADVHYDVKSLAKLFLKNQWVLPLKKREKARQSLEPKGSPSGASGLGEADADGSDAPDFGGGADDSDDDVHHDAEMPHHEAESESGVALVSTAAQTAASSGLALVSAPYKVNTVEVQYAKQAKKVDVKALKDGLWTQLLVEKPGAPVKKDMPSGATRDFQAVLNELPARLPKETRAEVSVPFAFICLLHLANEHNLEISNDGTLDKITIKKN